MMKLMPFAPKTRNCLQCGGMVFRYRSSDVSGFMDRFVWSCLLCARLFVVDLQGALKPWMVARPLVD